MKCSAQEHNARPDPGTEIQSEDHEGNILTTRPHAFIRSFKRMECLAIFSLGLRAQSSNSTCDFKSPPMRGYYPLGMYKKHQSEP